MRISRKAIYAMAAIASCACGQLRADVSLASIFTDEMILQRDVPVPVWGSAAPGERVSVSFAGQTKTVEAGSDGEWLVKLDPLKASFKPETLRVSGKNSVSVSDVLVGEIWIGSGQSNMEFMVKSVMNAEKELAQAGDPALRLFHVPQLPAVEAQSRVSGARWVKCDASTVKNFSAVSCFFGRELRKELNVPVGLIDSSWGGTRIEAWIPDSELRSHSFMTKKLDEQDARFAKSKALASELGKSLSGGDALWGQRPLAAVSSWREIELPCKWNQKGFDFNGVVRFHRDVEIPAEWQGRDLKLSIGATDKEDVTFFNGEKVGSVLFTSDNMNAWCFKRVYDVPAALLKKGSNAIDVRVRSAFFDGGMTGPAEVMNLSCPSLPDAAPIKLDGTWSLSVEEFRGVCSPGLPSQLYNGMIAPVAPFAIRGALWYQGESNEDAPAVYFALLSSLMKSWRSAWGEGEFPFYIVQLANYRAPKLHDEKSSWALLREAEAQAAALPNSGLASAIDIGDAADIHPKNKQEVGRRLALNALAKVYGFKDLVCRGPVFKAAKREGSAVRVSYESGAGLKTRDNAAPQGFVLAGSDGVFHEAGKVSIDGSTALVESDAVKDPCEIRYAWADNPVCNLVNGAGLPAEPFRASVK